MEEKSTNQSVELLEAPALWTRIPFVLSPESVTTLLESPNLEDRYFLRDRAILECLYATGCRVSEVVNMELKDLHLDSSFITCTGKGRKQRIVPLGKKSDFGNQGLSSKFKTIACKDSSKHKYGFCE